MAPPRHLPITIELRRTGATIISRRKPNSRSQTIEAAENIAVNITERQRTPGVDEGLQVDAVGAGCGELLQAGAEHEEEEQRLDQRGDDPHPVVGEADQLAPPDDLDRAQLAARLRGGTWT